MAAYSPEDVVQVMVMPEWDVEDFSPEWWNLVQTSPEFCEFWVRGYEAADGDDFLSFVPDGDDDEDESYPCDLQHADDRDAH
ncbi:hypothetical protein KP509_34G004400 [Ceratopteris richardii]|nr:hypothetical protein KP509_34G004400 [Ceratopteris richardii]